MNQLKSRILR